MFIWVFLILTALIVFFLCQKFLFSLRVSELKKKIRENPFIGTKEESGNYYLKEQGCTIGYRVQQAPGGSTEVEMVSLKRRLTIFEEKLLKFNKGLNDFFIYKKWLVLLRPVPLAILIISVFIFYFGIKEHSLKRIERFQWLIAQVAGVNPDSVEYSGNGKFTIYGRKISQDGSADLIAVNFKPFSWLFFSTSAQVQRWSEDLNRYVTYSVSINDKNEVWLDKESGKYHGMLQGNRIIWEEPPGDKYKASSHFGSFEGGKLKVIDE